MKNYISELITRYFIKRHNSDTEIKIQKWLIEDNQQRLKEIALINIWKNLNSKADKSVYRSLKEVNLKIGLKSSKRWFMRETLLRSAAILIPLLTIMGIWLDQNTHIDTIEVATYAGEQKKICLPDGSTVWLNACSKISYPKKFSDSLRHVTLTGEAYFAVVHNEKKQFVVNTEEITIRVLGTQFNIKAYHGDKLVTTTLTSGKVTVQSPKEKYTLSPNQELIYNTIDESTVIQVVTDNSYKWQDGSLIFNELTISEIFKELERKFGVKFTYRQTRQSEDKYSVKFTNGENLPQILDLLKEVTEEGFTYTYANNNIIIITIK